MTVYDLVYANRWSAAGLSPSPIWHMLEHTVLPPDFTIDIQADQ
jgi:hypothetical protein